MSENHEWKIRNTIFELMQASRFPMAASHEATASNAINKLPIRVGFRPRRYPDEEDSDLDPPSRQPENAEEKDTRRYNFRKRKAAAVHPSITDEQHSDSDSEFARTQEVGKALVRNVSDIQPQPQPQPHDNDNGKAGNWDFLDSDFEFVPPSLQQQHNKQHDSGLSFKDIGGLSEHLKDLKEMVLIPLQYPELFVEFNITPPKGVLFCGPPGTGKTLTARVLASTVSSKAGKEVKFYTRNGADILSKWAGESEKQLRELFEDARKNQPSIIFFDEIDGLCPARSSNQGDQIYNSIVSTLLALMDGLDSRGQVIVIGATNRVDSIDGALRRPGRFDREFTFTLPDIKARAEILTIHSRNFPYPLSDELKLKLAEKCDGYCGADLQALCNAAIFRAFREKYPQAYTSDTKIGIDTKSIRVEEYHFFGAMSTIIPAAHRGEN